MSPFPSPGEISNFIADQIEAQWIRLTLAQWRAMRELVCAHMSANTPLRAVEQGFIDRGASDTERTLLVLAWGLECGADEL